MIIVPLGHPGVQRSCWNCGHKRGAGRDPKCIHPENPVVGWDVVHGEEVRRWPNCEAARFEAKTSPEDPAPPFCGPEGQRWTSMAVLRQASQAGQGYATRPAKTPAKEAPPDLDLSDLGL